MAESQKLNLQRYNMIFKQLNDDVVLLLSNTDSIREDIKNYNRKFKIKKRTNEKSADKANYYI